MKFNETLRKLRQNKDLTQEALSKATGIGKSAIGMYEAGKREPSFETLEIFADFFNVSLDYLLGRDEREKKNTPIITPEDLDLLHKIKNLSEKERFMVDYLTRGIDFDKTGNDPS